MNHTVLIEAAAPVLQYSSNTLEPVTRSAAHISAGQSTEQLDVNKGTQSEKTRGKLSLRMKMLKFCVYPLF